MTLKNQPRKSGDLVLVSATDDDLILVGSYGIIIGEVNGKLLQTVSVVFNFTCPWLLKTSDNSEVINASGGPQRGIRTELLKATQKLRYQEFNCSEDPRAYKSRSVRVWKTDLTKR